MVVTQGLRDRAACVAHVRGDPVEQDSRGQVQAGGGEQRATLDDLVAQLHNDRTGAGRVVTDDQRHVRRQVGRHCARRVQQGPDAGPPRLALLEHSRRARGPRAGAHFVPPNAVVAAERRGFVAAVGPVAADLWTNPS